MSCIKEVSVKSIFPELRKEPDSSIRVNLANSVLNKNPKFIGTGHLTVDTTYIQTINFTTYTRAKNLNGLQRGKETDDGMGYMHDFVTMSETTAYRKILRIMKLKLGKFLSGKL